jgi:hypothetical protein
MRGARIPYSDAEMAWLEANRMMVISDYHRAFRERFGRPEISALHLHGLRKRKGWKTGREGDRYKGRNRTYTDAEVAWLRDNVTLETAECHRQFCERFDRPDLAIEKLIGLRKRYRFKTGRNGRFEKGGVSPNKGKKCPLGQGGRHPNAQRTQFKKGEIPHNHEGPGHESTDKDGYVWIVTDRRNPWTGASTWRIHKHRWLWEQANGPVPKGMALKCLGDKSNCDPSNWELVPKAILPRLNGKSGRHYDQAPAELKPTIMAVAKLEHKVRERAKAGT